MYSACLWRCLLRWLLLTKSSSPFLFGWQRDRRDWVRHLNLLLMSRL